MRAISPIVALFSAALAATGCGEGGTSQKTQTVIEISTDFDCSLLNDVTIALADKEGALTTVASTDECSNRSVGSLVFVPDTGTDRDSFFIVVVTAGLEVPASECEANGFLGCIVARRRMTFSSGTVDILLSNACVGNPCSFATTCVGSGECVPFTDP
ncbi:MAG TPA: hypothetical protein VK459_16855 [Polyangiaceae bacterium]|jgi:hypothetical protein|nr:hypothetical protein [Polyangiaceae bacterium]